MTAKVLVTGAAGILGRCVWSAATKTVDLDVTGVVHDQRQADSLEATAELRTLDLADLDAVRRLMAEGWDAVVNCAGVVRGRSVTPQMMMLLNAELPHVLSSSLNGRGRVIQVSTASVFSGEFGEYGEGALPDPDDNYARSKLGGELVEGSDLTVRTSFVGRDPVRGRGLLEWLFSQKGIVPGFAKVRWNGLTAPTLATVLVKVVRDPDVTGLLHVGGEVVSKAELLRMSVRAFGRKDIQVVPRDEPQIDRSLAVARMTELGIRVPPLKQQLEDLAAAS